MSDNILLKDIFDFDNLLKKYPGKRIKLRFNVSWTDVKNGVKKLWDYKEIYAEGGIFFERTILSIESNSGKKKRLLNTDVVFQFIEITPQKWLFINAYNIIDIDAGPDGFNSVTGKYFKTAKADILNEYSKYAGRVIVSHKNSPKQFFYTGENIINKVDVVEILSEYYLNSSDEFSGYENVKKSYKSLKQCINKKDWKNALVSVYGVYLITDIQTGKQYVGSAYGENGIWARWSIYLKNGYDKDEKQNNEYPNKQLKELVKIHGIKYITENFQYTILEIFPKTDIGRKKSLERESYWKEVLQTRKFGYNDN